MSGVFEVDFVSRLFLKKKNKRNGVKGGVLGLDKERKHRRIKRKRYMHPLPLPFPMRRKDHL